MSNRQLLLLLFTLYALPVAAAELTVELPTTPVVLEPGTLPLLLREGQILPSENEAVQELLPLLTDQQADAVVAALKARYGELITALEEGDPNDEVKNRATQGGQYGVAYEGTISSAMLYFIGSTYAAVQNHVAAEAAYKAALSAMPDYIRVHESLGMLYLLDGRHAEALPHLSRAVQLGLATPNVYGALGFVNYELENYFGAASAFQNAMMLAPDSVQWQQGLLSSLSTSKQNEQGLALVQQLLKARPNDSDLWVYRSSLELQAGRKPEGLNSLEVAIRLGDNEVGNLQVASALHLEVGSVDRAVELLGAGISQGLDFRFVNQGMQSLALHDEWGALQQLLDEYKDTSGLSDTQQSLLLLRRASVSRQNDNVTQAKTQLQQAIDLDPSNAEALLMLGKLQHQDKNYAQAELLLQRAAVDAEFAETASLTLAQVAIDQHDYDKALGLLRDVLAANPARSDLARNIQTLESLVQLDPGN